MNPVRRTITQRIARLIPNRLHIPLASGLSSASSRSAGAITSQANAVPPSTPTMLMRCTHLLINVTSSISQSSQQRKFWIHNTTQEDVAYKELSMKTRWFHVIALLLLLSSATFAQKNASSTEEGDP